jgi:hypothetical protein
MTTITDPTAIEAARLLALRQMLRLELLGMRHRGRSAYSIIKSEFGLRGSRQSVFDALTQWRDTYLQKG